MLLDALGESWGPDECPIATSGFIFHERDLQQRWWQQWPGRKSRYWKGPGSEVDPGLFLKSQFSASCLTTCGTRCRQFPDCIFSPEFILEPVLYKMAPRMWEHCLPWLYLFRPVILMTQCQEVEASLSPSLSD